MQRQICRGGGERIAGSSRTSAAGIRREGDNGSGPINYQQMGWLVGWMDRMVILVWYVFCMGVCPCG